MQKYKNAILFYNTDSGRSKSGHYLDIIIKHFDQAEIPLNVIRFPVPGEEIHKTIDKTSCAGADLIIAAGGDGTISLISRKVIGTEIPLGILPLGTGNVLAQQLQVPLNFTKALSLITDESSRKIIMDTIQYDHQYGLLNVSVGLTPQVMQKTKAQEKQRFGFLAYLIHFIRQFLGLKRHRFFIEYDGHNTSYFASEVLITNVQFTGVESLKWANNISINDGQLDLFIIRSTNITDILELLLSLFHRKRLRRDVVQHITFSDYCRIETQTPMITQADGDPFGETPIEVKLIPNSLNVIVSQQYSQILD